MQEWYNLHYNSVLCLCKNSTFDSRSKQIDVRYHLTKHVLEEKHMHIQKVHRNEKGSNMVTKCFAKTEASHEIVLEWMAMTGGPRRMTNWKTRSKARTCFLQQELNFGAYRLMRG